MHFKYSFISLISKKSQFKNKQIYMDILPHLCNTGFLEMQRQIDPQGSLFIHSSFLMRQFQAYVYDNLWMIVMFFSGHNLQSHTLTQYTHMYITLNSHIKTKWSKYSSLIVSVSQTQNHIILKHSIYYKHLKIKAQKWVFSSIFTRWILLLRCSFHWYCSFIPSYPHII